MILLGLIRALIFIWVMMAAMIGMAVGVGHLLPSGDEMTYTKTLSSGTSPIVTIFLKDMNRSIEGRLSGRLDINILPKWSPDGQHIAYLSPSDGVDHFYVMDATGNNKRQLQLPFTTINNRYLWSPDSQWILISATVDGIPKNAVIHVPTGKIYILSQVIQFANWSPDSQVIFYQMASESGRAHIIGANIHCLIQPIPCEFKELSFLQNQDFYSNLEWSPDGHHLAFTSISGGQSNLVVASLRCADLVESCIEKYTVIVYRVYDEKPIWSADGKRLAYIKGPTELGITSIETSESRAYKLAEELVFLQNWSPDSRFITYISNPMALLGNDVYYVLDVQTGESAPLFQKYRTVDALEWRPLPR